MILVVVLSLAAAFCNAASSVLQKHGSRETPADESLNLRLNPLPPAQAAFLTTG